MFSATLEQVDSNRSIPWFASIGSSIRSDPHTSYTRDKTGVVGTTPDFSSSSRWFEPSKRRHPWDVRIFGRYAAVGRHTPHNRRYHSVALVNVYHVSHTRDSYHVTSAGQSCHDVASKDQLTCATLAYGSRTSSSPNDTARYIGLAPSIQCSTLNLQTPTQGPSLGAYNSKQQRDTCFGTRSKAYCQLPHVGVARKKRELDLHNAAGVHKAPPVETNQQYMTH